MESFENLYFRELLKRGQLDTVGYQSGVCGCRILCWLSIIYFLRHLADALIQSDLQPCLVFCWVIFPASIGPVLINVHKCTTWQPQPRAHTYRESISTYTYNIHIYWCVTKRRGLSLRLKRPQETTPSGSSFHHLGARTEKSL